MVRKRVEVKAGDIYGRLTIIREVEPRPYAIGKFHRRVECRCECGVVKEYLLPRLRNGGTKSCGCLAREQAVINGNRTTHGGTGTAEYSTWTGMRERCNNSKSAAYAYYGGRGIKICERWQKFSNFLKDMGEKPSAEHSIDRINNNGNYEPGNCRWATVYQQARNRSNNVMVTHNGKTLCVSEWANKYNMKSTLLNYRLRAGWEFEKAVSTAISDFNPQLPISKRTPEWYREFAKRETVE